MHEPPPALSLSFLHQAPRMPVIRASAGGDSTGQYCKHRMAKGEVVARCFMLAGRFIDRVVRDGPRGGKFGVNGWNFA